MLTHKHGTSRQHNGTLPNETDSGVGSGFGHQRPSRPLICVFSRFQLGVRQGNGFKTPPRALGTCDMHFSQILNMKHFYGSSGRRKDSNKLIQLCGLRLLVSARGDISRYKPSASQAADDVTFFFFSSMEKVTHNHVIIVINNQLQAEGCLNCICHKRKQNVMQEVSVSDEPFSQ